MCPPTCMIVNSRITLLQTALNWSAHQPTPLFGVGHLISPELAGREVRDSIVHSRMRLISVKELLEVRSRTAASTHI